VRKRHQRRHQHRRGAAVHGPDRELRERVRREHAHDRNNGDDGDHDHVRFDRLDGVDRLDRFDRFHRVNRLHGLDGVDRLDRFHWIGNPVGRSVRGRRRWRRLSQRRGIAQLRFLPAEPRRLLGGYWTGFVPFGYVTSVAVYSIRVPG
jgi:hypothetical protein